MCCVIVSNCVVKVHDVVFNTDSRNLVFWVSVVVDITEISAMVAAAGVLVGVVYYLLDIRNQAMIRKTALITNLYSTFGSEEHQRAGKKVLWITYEDYDDFVKKYGAPNSEEPIPVAIDRVLYFFEELGVLLSKKLVDIDLIDQLMGYNIMMIGTKTMPIIEEVRKRLDLPRVWKNFEYLYNEMQKREQKPQQSTGARLPRSARKD
jgi:hypothetical protein